MRGKIDPKDFALRAGHFLVILTIFRTSKRSLLSSREQEEVRRFRDLLMDVQRAEVSGFEEVMQGRLTETVVWVSRLVVILDDLLRGGWGLISVKEDQFLLDEVEPLLERVVMDA